MVIFIFILLPSQVPRSLPYFAVDFGLQGGFAHVIENEQKFPHYFGKVSGCFETLTRHASPWAFFFRFFFFSWLQYSKISVRVTSLSSITGSCRRHAGLGASALEKDD